jgi:hypothetical protein
VRVKWEKRERKKKKKMKGEADEMVKRVFFNLKQFLQREKGRDVADEGDGCD